MCEHEPTFWKRMWRLFVLIVVLLIGVWLCYLAATELPEPIEVVEWRGY